MNIPSRIRFPLFSLIITFTNSCYAGWEDTVVYINGLLDEGKKVALLLIDMQAGFMDRYTEPEFSRVIEEQARLIDHFADRPGMFYVDVNYAGNKRTLSSLYLKLKKNTKYKLLIKKDNSAFHSRQEFPKRGSRASDEEIRGQLDKYLNEIKVTDVMIMGCFDGACIRETAIDALQNGFSVGIDRELNIIDDETSPLNRKSPKAREALRKQRWEDVQKMSDKLTFVPPAEQRSCEASD